MKTDIHPQYQEVVFQDIPTGETFLTRSTIQTKSTIDIDDKTYPLVRLEVSSASHPFYTGKQNIGSVKGRVERFKQKYDM